MFTQRLLAKAKIPYLFIPELKLGATDHSEELKLGATDYSERVEARGN